MDHPVGSVYVDLGSIYNPGWQIVKVVEERQEVVLRTFDTEAEALEELPYYQKEYAS